MNGAARRVGRLKETLNLDNLMLDEMEFSSINDSPLQLMSPNIVLNKVDNRISLQEKGNESKIKAVDNHAVGNHQDATELKVKEEDELAPLPALKNKKKADPRRQSTAIFSMFEATTSGNGLLNDSELAIGDEDMELLIPLAKSNAALASKGINNLWVDPDIDDAMLEETLPEPTLQELQAVASAAATAAPSPTKKGTPLAGVRDSVAMFAGFSSACDSSPGIDTVKEGDFLLSPREKEALATTKTAAAVAAPVMAEEKKEKETKAVALVRKPSRLKPPSSSSSFFSYTTTNAPVLGAVDVQPKRRPKQTSKPTVETSKPVDKVVLPVVEEKKIDIEQPKPLQPPRKLPASRLPVKSRLPRPTAPTPAPRPAPVQQKPVQRVVTKPKAPIARAAIAAVAKTPGEKVGSTAASTSSSSSPADDTPRTAHLKWLEAHPELAFGGGPKIANSPEAEEVPKKKSAEDMHYESWGSSLTYELHDRK